MKNLDQISKKGKELYKYLYNNYEPTGYLKNQLPIKLRNSIKELRDNHIVILTDYGLKIMLSKDYLSKDMIRIKKNLDKEFYDFLRNKNKQIDFSQKKI